MHTLFLWFFSIFLIVDLGMAKVKKEKKIERKEKKQKEDKKEGKILSIGVDW